MSEINSQRGFDSRLYFALRVEAIPIKLDLLELISCHTLEIPLRKQTEREGPLVSGVLCEAHFLWSVLIVVLFYICCLLGVNGIAFFSILITFILIKPQRHMFFIIIYFYSASIVVSFLLFDISL